MHLKQANSKQNKLSQDLHKLFIISYIYGKTHSYAVHNGIVGSGHSKRTWRKPGREMGEDV